MLKAYKYRIYPNSEQRIQIAKTFGCCRFVYNQTLAYRKEIYEKEKKSVSKTDCNNYCNRELKKDYEWLKEIDKFALTNAIYNMDAAYQKFFKEHAGYPKFKSKHDNHKSYTTNFTNGNIAVDFETGKIKLPKLKAVKARLHRGYSGQIKSATVSQLPSEKYYVTILVETEHKELVHTTNSIGIDLGIKDLAVCSDAVKYKNINKSQKVKKLEKQKRRLQRSISRSYEKNKKGESYCKTNNVIKKEKLLLKRNHRLTNIRKNYLNQTISEIVNRKPRFICIEDLNVSGMMKNRHLSKAVQAQGFFGFRKQLEYKCSDKGIQLIVADRFYPSSKLCSCCGNIKKDLKLSDRVYRCACGNMIDRDFQASINLKTYGEQFAS